MPPPLHKIYVCLTLLFHLGSTSLGNPKQGILSQFHTNDLELQNVRKEQTYKYVCICTVFFIRLLQRLHCTIVFRHHHLLKM